LLLMAVAAPPTQIAELRPSHWPAVAQIYAEGIATGDATFETETPPWEAWDAGHLTEHRFVALQDRQVVGWVAARAVSDRCAYSGVVEHSVYVAETMRGLGIGRSLLEALIASTEAAGIWTIQTGIFPENTPSLRLHEHAGFEVVGRRKRIGKLAGVWRDVIAVERRSPAVD
jgi:phosphinothricin acetyltransferase